MSLTAGEIRAHLVGKTVSFTIEQEERSVHYVGPLVAVRYIRRDVEAWLGPVPVGRPVVEITVDLPGAGMVTFSVSLEQTLVVET